MKARFKKFMMVLGVFLTTLKDMGKWIAFAIEIWAMWLMVQFAVSNNWSKEILDSLMPGITALFQTIAIVVGASLGVDKIATKVLDYLGKKNSNSNTTDTITSIPTEVQK